MSQAPALAPASSFDEYPTDIPDQVLDHVARVHEIEIRKLASQLKLPVDSPTIVDLLDNSADLGTLRALQKSWYENDLTQFDRNRFFETHYFSGVDSNHVYRTLPIREVTVIYYGRERTEEKAPLSENQSKDRLSRAVDQGLLLVDKTHYRRFKTPAYSSLEEVAKETDRNEMNLAYERIIRHFDSQHNLRISPGDILRERRISNGVYDYFYRVGLTVPSHVWNTE